MMSKIKVKPIEYMNKVHCVYIGKQLDQSKAMKRIADKELQIRLDKS